MSSGRRAGWASTTAGARLAAAVPDVTLTAGGVPVAFARPSAKNPPLRSSICDHALMRCSRASASSSGELRDPGEVTAWRIPQRASSSTKARRRMWESMMRAVRDLVLLHGFTQTRAAWRPIAARVAERYRLHAPDLRGHGAASDVRPVGFDAVLKDIVALADGPVTLAGYSMGGRIAQLAALAHPGWVGRLVLVSTSPGIADEDERAARRRADDEL